MAAKNKRKGAAAAKKCSGQKQLAKLLGISQPRVCKLLKRDGWKWGKGPWSAKDVAEIRTWLKSLRDRNNASYEPEVGGDALNSRETAEQGDDGAVEDGSQTRHEALRQMLGRLRPYDRLKLAGGVERAIKTEIENRVLLGNLIDRSKVEAELLVVRDMHTARFKGAAPLLALKLAGKPVGDCEKIVDAWVREQCRLFGDDLQKLCEPQT